MDNFRGAALMVLAMAAFAIEDMLIKLMSATLPTWQIVMCLGVGGAILTGLTLARQGQPLFPAAALGGWVVLRNLGELIGTIGFVTALALTPISTASAILQATPLVVTLGAALFFGEQVGWRRWSAVGAGFLGVLIIIRPGMEGFSILSLFAVQGVIGLAIRDMATRRVPARTSGMQLSFLAFLTLVPAGLILAAITGHSYVPPDALHWLMLGGSAMIGVLAYLTIVAAMRTGEISFVTAFRYSRILFALAVGMIVFSERPDAWTWAGATLIVVSGLYTLIRERQVQRQSVAAVSATKG